MRLHHEILVQNLTHFLVQNLTNLVQNVTHFTQIFTFLLKIYKQTAVVMIKDAQWEQAQMNTNSFHTGPQRTHEQQ